MGWVVIGGGVIPVAREHKLTVLLVMKILGGGLLAKILHGSVDAHPNGFFHWSVGVGPKGNGHSYSAPVDI